MPFPDYSVIDDFNRANGPVTSGSWVSPALTGMVSPEISGSALTGASAGFASAYWSASLSSASQQAYFTLSALPADFGYATILLRFNPSTQNGYEFSFKKEPGSNQIIITRVDAGSGSDLTNSFVPTFNAGDKFGAEISGSTLTIYRYNGTTWSSVLTTGDNTYSSGSYAAVFLNDTTARVDDFSAGPFATGPAVAAYAFQFDAFQVYLDTSASGGGAVAEITGYLAPMGIIW